MGIILLFGGILYSDLLDFGSKNSSLKGKKKEGERAS